MICCDEVPTEAPETTTTSVLGEAETTTTANAGEQEEVKTTEDDARPIAVPRVLVLGGAILAQLWLFMA